MMHEAIDMGRFGLVGVGGGGVVIVGGEEEVTEEGARRTFVPPLSPPASSFAIDDDDDDDDKKESTPRPQPPPPLLPPFSSRLALTSTDADAATEMMDAGGYRSAATVAAQSSKSPYHPEFMFCGDCTSCCAPPPPPMLVMNEKFVAMTMMMTTPTTAMKMVPPPTDGRKRRATRRKTRGVARMPTGESAKEVAFENDDDDDGDDDYEEAALKIGDGCCARGCCGGPGGGGGVNPNVDKDTADIEMGSIAGGKRGGHDHRHGDGSCCGHKHDHDHDHDSCGHRHKHHHDHKHQHDICGGCCDYMEEEKKDCDPGVVTAAASAAIAVFPFGRQKKGGGAAAAEQQEKIPCAGGGCTGDSNGRNATHRTLVRIAGLTSTSQALVVRKMLQPDHADSSALDPAFVVTRASGVPKSPRARRGAKVFQTDTSASITTTSPAAAAGGSGGGNANNDKDDENDASANDGAKLDGVHEVSIDLSHGIVAIDHDPLVWSASDIVSRLRAANYNAVLLRDGADDLARNAAATLSTTTTTTTTLMPDPIPRAACRSQLYVSGICCASEVPAVTSILKKCRAGKAVTDVSINIPARYVYVDHDPFAVTAKELANELNKQGFGARIKRDGGRGLPRPASASACASDSTVLVMGVAGTSKPLCRSQLYVSGICCASEVPAVTSILKKCRGGKAVTDISINIPARYVYVDHDPFAVSAKELANELNKEGFGARVKRDGAKGSTTTTSAASMGHAEASPPSPGVHSGEVRSAFALLDRRGGGGGSSSNGNGNAAKGGTEGGVHNGGAGPILVPSDVPKIQNILSAIQGVTRIGVNVRYGMVYADHEHDVVDANAIRLVLERNGYPVVVRLDGCAERFRELKAMENEGEEGRRQRRSSGDNCYDGVGAAAAAATKDTTNTTTIAGIGTVSSSRYVESTLMLPYLDNLDRVRRLEKFMSRHFVKAQVRAFYPHVPSRTVKVEHDPGYVSARSIVESMMQEGGATVASGKAGGGGGAWCDGAEVAVDGAAEGLALPLMEDYDDGEVAGRAVEEEEAVDDASNSILGGLRLNVILSGIFWVVSMLSFKEGWDNLKYFGLLSVLFGIPPVAAKAFRTIRRCQFDANCMMVVAALGALALREFDEAASVSFLFAVSELLESRATAKARRALGAIVSLRPDHASVVDPATGRVVVVPASCVPVGSRVSVRAGDKVPADGVVAEGSSSVDESSLTGEARPVDKRPNDAVSGGSINIGPSRLIVRTTSTVDDSAVSRLIRLVEEAQANRSPTEKIVDAFARRYTPFVVFVAGLMCTIPWLWGREVGRYWTLNGLVIIVIACPCALTISTPVTYAAGLAATAQRGVIVKGGARLEALGNVKTIVFDKTGTLTEGRFRLVHLETVGCSKSRKELLQLLAVVEAPSSHPMSATLVEAAKKEGAYMPNNFTLSDHTILKGEGVSAKVNGEAVFVGNERLFRRLGMYDSLDPRHRTAAEEWAREGGTVGYLGTEGEGIVGAFCVSDGVREESRSVVRALQDDGIDVIMLTGDGDGAARAVGREVGLPDACIHSQLLPEDKLHFVSSLKSSGQRKSRVMCGSKEHVLMCGDGVNDAPALAVSDVGVAMGEGAALAMEMSDVTLMDSNLTKLYYSIKMGKRVIRTIRENIIFSLVAKLLVVGLTFVGKMTLLLAIASDVGVMLIVTLNGMKLLPGRRADLKSERVKTARKGQYGKIPLEVKSDRLPEVV